MSRFAPLALAAILLTAAAGGVGGCIGVQYGLRQAAPHPGLDAALHHELKLAPDQNARIETLERDFAGRRRALEAEMEAANRDLAAALRERHAYGPEARKAIDRFHAAMGQLQEATIEHVLAMRAVLTPEQAARFDKTISEALASDPR